MSARGGEPGEFGDLLRKLRVASGLSQEELAERAGLSARGLSDLERGLHRAPHRDTAQRLADALELGATERAALLAGRSSRVRIAPRTATSPWDLSGVSPNLVQAPTAALPLQLSSFVGREQEVVQLRRLLQSTRLFTLVGTGGVGKTRLALQVADEVRSEYADGAWLVELAALAEPGLVPQAVSSRLGIREQPGRPLSDTLADALSHKHLLLILDNCEHVLHACAELVQTLLERCAGLRILATSRETLRVAGETAWRVPPLSVPPADQEMTVATLAAHEAPCLFLDRARAVVPGLAIGEREATAIAAMCRRLDGIPLAIELAAARVRVLGLEQLAERLDDQLRLLVGGVRGAPSRQQTLRATLDWSYALLPDTERALLRRLAVFAGGWTLEAAEALAAVEGIGAAQVLDLLEHLVDKSLVLVEDRHGHARYRLLEPIRQYAHEQLVASGEAETAAQRHATYFLALAKTAEDALWVPQPNTWQQRLEQEHDNLRGALRWLTVNGDVVRAQDLGSALARFWLLGGYHREGRTWLTELVRLGSAAEPSVVRANVLIWTGTLAGFQGDYAAARQFLEQGLAIAQQAGDREATAHALYRLADVAWWSGDHTTAAAMGEAALAASRAAGHGALEASSLFSLGAAAWGRGEFVEASARLDECLVLSRQIGFQRGVAMALGMLGRVSLAQADLDLARAQLASSQEVFGSIDFPWGVALVLVPLGWVALERGELARSRALLLESVQLYEQLGERGWVLKSLEGFAALAVAEERHEQAARLAGAVSSLRAQAAAYSPPVEREALERWLNVSRARLGAKHTELAEAAGRLLSLEEAIAEAVTIRPDLPVDH
jgi:predicted ATPase/DNA-binding XRE family transcriptional regulator